NLPERLPRPPSARAAFARRRGRAFARRKGVRRMAKKRSPCPVCGGTACRVGEQAGYCRVKRSRWERKLMSPEEMRKAQPGPIPPATLSQFLLDLMRWTYKVVGRYLYPTLEQWELGFMRDRHVEDEVGFWYRAAFAFITYHKRRNVPLRSDDEEKSLV